MQVIELDRTMNSSGEMIARYEAGKLSVQLIGTFGDLATLDELLYAIGCRKIKERLG